MEARANARLAMMLALGELQRLAGPDARVTATADIAGTAEGLRLDPGDELGNGLSVSGNPKGLLAPIDATRRWTGVWRSADDPARIFDKTPCVKRLGWLVGGHAPNPNDPTLALGSDGQPAYPDKAVKLVGGEGTVTAPWLNLKSGGRCAWWVGDEGVKARVDLTSPLPAGEAADELVMAAPRRDWRVIDGMAAYPPAGSPEEAFLENMISSGDLRLIDPSLGMTDLTHVATTWSRGVLCDTLRGGLKGDLTPLSWDLPRDLPEMDAPLIPESAAPNLVHLKWQVLRDFARLRKEARDGILIARHEHEGIPGVGPVMDELRLLFGARLVPSAGGKFRVHPCVKVTVRFTNPFTMPLRWEQPLELEFFNMTYPRVKPTRIYGAYGEPAILPRYLNEPALLNRAVFVVPPGMLPPGESEAFTINTPVSRKIIQAASRFEVPLAPYDAASGGDYRNCLRFEHPSPNSVTGEWRLHLQEETGTSQMDLAIRLDGEDGELRRIERIEINNLHHYHCEWRIPPGMAGRYEHPVPLQLYVLSTGLENGPTPSGATCLGLDEPVVSAVRTFADFNLRAGHFRKPIICHQPPPYGLRMADKESPFPSAPPGGETGSAFLRGLDVKSPRRVWLHAPEKLISLAQFQHADLTADDTGISVGHQPGNAFGNSYATPFVHRERVMQKRSDFKVLAFTELDERRTNYYDISYLLNASLWDGWFFSTLPENEDGGPENPRLVASDTTDETLPPAAKYLMDGAFNVNSVDPAAWAALLAGLNDIPHPSDTSTATGAMLPRSPGQLGVADESDGICEGTLAGYRRLTPEQIHLLAGEIVRQVRLRGPFTSLSHFVNRALVPMAENPESGRGGALQCAIDQSGINLRNSSDGSCDGLFDAARGQLRLHAEASGAPAADIPGPNPTRWADSPPDGIWPKSSYDINPGSLAGIFADREVLTDDELKPEQGHRATGMPGWLTQADVLQVIGPALSARSDTFRIRTCGESSRKVGGAPVRVFCEAIVQRMPEYLDPSNRPNAMPEDLTFVNQRLGRKIRIVSFRWLVEGAM